MIRCANDKETVIALKAIELVKEEGAVAVIDETVQIFEDDDTRRHLACFSEHLGHGSLFAHETCVNSGLSGVNGTYKTI
jgi:hypothetical protein